MSGGALGRAAGSALNRGPTQGSVMSSTLLLAGSQALGILLEPGGVKRATFNDFSVSPGEASDTVSYIAGTVETIPHLISYFDFHSKKVKNDAQVAQMLINAGLDGLAGYVAGGGTFGITPDPPTAYIGLAEGAVLGAIVAGLGQLRTASYRYYCGFLYGICHGLIDSIEAVKVDERIVSFGAPAGNQFLIDDPYAWGGDHVDGGVYALCKSIPGNFWPTQNIDPYIAAQLGANTSSWSGKALFLMYGFTGYPESGYFAATPQGAPALRPLKLRVKRLPDNLDVTAYHDINGDANLAECCYEWLTSPVFGVKKLPVSKIDVASFQLGAQTHFDRGLGISLEMNADTDVETALDKFTALGDSLIYYSFNSGTIRYKVIERDYSFASLPIFRRGPDGSSPELYNVIKVDGFTPGTWANTANDFSFDYIDRDNNYLKATRYVQDTANKMLTGRTRSLSQSLDGVSNGASAALVGTRELRAGSYPRPPFSLTVNRDGYNLEPGDVIRYIDNIDNFQKVLRVGEVQAPATDSTAEIGLNCTEDQYGVGAAAVAPYVAPGFALTLHLHFEVEDSLSELDDALGKFMVVASSGGFADSLNLSDAITVQLGSASSLALSDSIDNLTDAIITSGTSFPFTVPDLTNLALWVKADEGAYVDAGTTLATNGQTIQQWNDFSGNNHHVSQATSGARPTLISGALNGRAVIEFSEAGGHDDFLSVADNADLELNTDSSVFVVAKYVSVHGQSAFAHKGNAYIYYLTGSGKQEIDRPFSSNGGVSTTDVGITNYHVLAAIVSGTGVSYYFDGAADGTTTVATGTANATDFTIGEFGGSGNLSARVAEILVYKSAISSTDRDTVIDYLGAKWGIAT